MHTHPYRALALNLTLSFVAMYLAMFAMIDGAGDFFNNLNMAYMAVLMLAPMGVLMLLLMPSMYRDSQLNLVLHLGFIAAFALALAGIRTQTGIDDHQFLRSMIPHHSGAILMCRKAAIRDGEIAELCRRIEESQRREIEQMRRILARM